MFGYEKQWLAVIRIFMGYLFIHSAWEKMKSPDFASHLDQVLNAFASKNPTGWYKSLLTLYFIPQSPFFAQLVMWGELFAGLSLFFGALTPLGALIALFLNANFFFAAGWTSAAAHTVNFLMMIIEIALIFSNAGKTWGLDLFLWKKNSDNY